MNNFWVFQIIWTISIISKNFDFLQVFQIIPSILIFSRYLKSLRFHSKIEFSTSLLIAHYINKVYSSLLSISNNFNYFNTSEELQYPPSISITSKYLKLFRSNVVFKLVTIHYNSYSNLNSLLVFIFSNIWTSPKFFYHFWVFRIIWILQ